MTTQFSVLYSAEQRPLPVALAHEFAALKWGKEGKRLDMLNRIYLELSPADRMRCRIELAQCRRAKMGEVRAEVVG